MHFPLQFLEQDLHTFLYLFMKPEWLVIKIKFYPFYIFLPLVSTTKESTYVLRYKTIINLFSPSCFMPMVIVMSLLMVHYGLTEKTKQIFVLEYLCTIRNKDRFLSFLAGGWQWCHFYILQTSISVFLVSANSLVFHNKQMVPSLFFWGWLWVVC